MRLTSTLAQAALILPITQRGYKSPNCRYMQQKRAWPATRTDLLGILCTRRYFNKLVMRSAYVQNTDTNLKRSPDSFVLAVAVLGRSMVVWGPLAVRWPF